MPGIPLDEPRWDDILGDFRNSGLTHVEFCRQRQLPLATFRRRLYRDRSARAAAQASPPSTTPFLPVTVLPEPSPPAAPPPAPPPPPRALPPRRGPARAVAPRRGIPSAPGTDPPPRSAGRHHPRLRRRDPQAAP